MSGFATPLQQRRWQFAQRANVEFQTAILHHGVLADLVIDLQNTYLLLLPAFGDAPLKENPRAPGQLQAKIATLQASR